jgi:hypothetical protein
MTPGWVSLLRQHTLTRQLCLVRKREIDNKSRQTEENAPRLKNETNLNTGI